ncbi:hypothetical protein AM571_PC02164 (plasmid) [Rhizobium etli 8C-3]|uniref:DUF2934 family protein n=2 Tax=Rhizobium TaxID=379 RepID=A0A4V2VCZ1_9HYPH|nr:MULTISPECIES: DUF2934 domain-containing protein [Rhizobium]APO79890.1 hypothetical protein AM571_PC02164 [Rhizobium etli 8C-3]TCU30685.1 DUF2934 family protein [Rhizobium azibense]TCU41304.1 DUF2934 family protein [Rhizobium azibense]
MSRHDRNEWIAKRAYALWEACGRQDGRDGEHWAQAVRERDELERTQASADGREVLIRFRPRPPAATSSKRAVSPASRATG